MLNESNEAEARAAERLRSESVIWFTTVSPEGVPEPTPVWFLWEGGDDVLIYTQPGSLKLRNLGSNDRVALNLNSDEHGGEVVVFLGRAVSGAEAPVAHENEAYLSKYRAGMGSIGLTPEQFSESFSVPVRVRVTHTRVG